MTLRPVTFDDLRAGGEYVWSLRGRPLSELDVPTGAVVLHARQDGLRQVADRWLAGPGSRCDDHEPTQTGASVYRYAVGTMYSLYEVVE